MVLSGRTILKARTSIRDSDNNPFLKDKAILKDLDSKAILKDSDNRAILRNLDNNPFLRDLDNNLFLRDLDNNPFLRDLDNKAIPRDNNPFLKVSDNKDTLKAKVSIKDWLNRAPPTGTSLLKDSTNPVSAN